jgi:uncharacterized protein (DUF433 family)
MFDYAPVQHIEIRDGEAKIIGRNVKVKMVISRLVHGKGATIPEVMEQYRLTQAQVMSVLAYYYDHQAEIDADFEREDAMMQSVPALSDLFEKYNWVKK